MCGIAGIISSSLGAELSSAVQKMSAELAHRGPDGQGAWIDPMHGVALAHRRLAILDLSEHGHQPMSSATGRYVLSYNGEIYNFGEIRDALDAASLSPKWRGQCDTEVLLAAIEAWGLERTLCRLSGMFAIALWDRESASLFLARDRVGEKPLYYGTVAQGFVFASELKAIRAIARGALELNSVVLSEFMQFGYIPSPNCIWRGLAKLPAGHFIRIGPKTVIGEPEAYWNLDSNESVNLREQLSIASDRQLEDWLHDRLVTSVRLQMTSDVPLGAFLSGGVDSSLVVALMQSQSSRPIRTYTIGFGEEEFDEAPYARRVAQHLGTEHTELYVSAADAAGLVPELPSIYDEPFADSSQIPTSLVARLTRQHVTVSLSGDGGDELFAGYPRYEITADLWAAIERLPLSLRALTAAGLRTVSPRAWDRFFALVIPKSQRNAINGRRVHRLAQLVRSQSLAEMYTRLMSHWEPEDGLVLGVRSQLTDRLRWTATGTEIDQMRRWDLSQYLPDDLLVKVDRAAMSASLESRAPLLDHRVVEFAFALPNRVLVRDGVGKWLLRNVLHRYCPREIFERPKAGFSVPLAEWLRGPLREWAAELLDPARLRTEALLDPDQISQLWHQHQTRSYDRSYYLWNVIAFQAWYRFVTKN